MLNRRTFLGFPLVLVALDSEAKEVVSQNEPTAKAIGYVEKTPIAGSVCSNCIQAQDDGGKNIPCNLFPNKLVNRDGWCKVYVKR